MGGIKTNQAFKGSEIWWNDFQMTLKMHFKILLLVLFLQVTIFLVFLKWTMRENACRISETISMGLTDSRDGRSLTKGRKRELVILPSEIQSLKKREAYVKFPEHNPVLLKVEITKANKLPDVTEPFIMRPGLTLDSIIKRQEEISIKASALTEGVEISEEPDGSRQKTDVLKDVAKETMENDSPV